MPTPEFGSIYIKYQWDMLRSERNADDVQEFMGTVEVHLFHAGAIDAQQIPI